MIKVTLTFPTPQAAANFLQSMPSGSTGPAIGVGTTAPPPTPPSTTISPSSPPPGVTMGNAPPPPSAPPAPAATPPPPAAPPAPPASVAPPAPPPAPARPAASGLHAEVLQGMQAWSKAGHKAAGIKRVFAKAGIASVSEQTPPATLEWLKWAFSPQPDGSYLTPEYIESLQ